MIEDIKKFIKEMGFEFKTMTDEGFSVWEKKEKFYRVKEKVKKEPKLYRVKKNKYNEKKEV